ncbi:hypothetical protein [Variovorax sp. GB1P17]|uniref:hypothetical protein n=1 Tax=Variovorax sp. GB1P17 TaxID=3443740 RepID=UPI003F46EC0A
MDTVLRLGDVAFAGLEVPEFLSLGGSQRLAIKNFPGGARNIQSLGPDHAPIPWSGMFLGPDALDRAKHLDFLRVQGAPQQLTVFDSTYTVVIERFEFKTERFYKVPYSIVVQVVSDDSQPVESLTGEDFDTGIEDDCDTLGDMANTIGDSTLTSAVSGLSTAVGAVQSFASATGSVVSGVLGAAASVSSRISTLTASVQSALNSVSVVGGVLPNIPLPASIASMAAQVTATAQYPVLVNMNSVVNRLTRNITAASQQSSTRLLQVAGGTLFDVAANEYGDATRWIAIAQASGLTDAVLTGVNTLTVPARPLDSGGVPVQ